MADWGYEDYEYQWHSDSCLMEIFVHEQDAKKYVAEPAVYDFRKILEWDK